MTTRNLLRNTSFWVLLWGVSLLALIIAVHGFYPVNLTGVNDYPVYHYPPIFWFSLSAFILVNVGGCYSTQNPKMFLLASGFLMPVIYLNYDLFQSVAGSDSALFMGITEGVKSTANLSPSFGIYPWPGLFVITSQLSQITNLSIGQSALEVVLVLGPLMCIALISFFRKVSNSNLLVYLLPIWYFVAFHRFINWQFAPQTMALVLLSIILAYVSNEGLTGRKSLAVFSLLSAALVLVHPFFWIFLIFGWFGTLIFSRLWKTKDVRVSIAQPATRFILVLVGLTVAYELLFAPSILSDIRSVISHPFVGIRQLVPLVSPVSGGSVVALDPVFSILDYTNLFAMTLTLVPASILLLYRLYRRNLSGDEFSIFFAALVFFIIGDVGTLSSRAIQVGAIVATASVAYAARNKKLSRYITIITLIALFSLPITVARYSWYSYPQFLGTNALAFTGFAESHGLRAQNFSTYVLTDKSTADYVRGSTGLVWLAPAYLTSNVQTPSSAGCLGAFKVFLLTPELGHEAMAYLCSPSRLRTAYGNLIDSSDIVYSSGRASTLFVLST